MTSNSDPKLSDLLEDLEVDNLSPEVLEKLNEKIGERSAFELANMQKFQLVRLLREEVLPDSSKKERSEIADVLIDSLQDMLRGATPAATPAAPTGPIEVTVKQEKTPEQMDVSELLKLLQDNPSKHAVLLPLIMERDLVKRVTERRITEWAIPDENGKLDSEKTLRYLQHLGQVYSKPQREWEGVRPITLAKALGIEARALIHPFMERPVQGPDENGYDFSKLSDELHEALLWALTTKHSAWPQTVDIFTVSEEVFQNPLPRRWQRILEDYQYAKANNPDSVRHISRYWPENVSFDQVHQSVQQPRELTEGDYRQMLMDNAQAPRNQSSGAVHLNAELITSFSTMSGSVHLDSTIVLQTSGTMSGSLNGTVYVPRGVQIYTQSGSNHLKTYVRSYENLCRLAGLI